MGLDPVTDAVNDGEHMMYQVSLARPEFAANNKMVWNKLVELIQGEPAYEWIRRWEQSQNGRQAMLTLRSHCEGEGTPIDKSLRRKG